MHLRRRKGQVLKGSQSGGIRSPRRITNRTYCAVLIQDGTRSRTVRVHERRTVPDGSERHVDRVFNVLGSGQWHIPYFSALTEVLAAAFDDENLCAQPQYVVDTGCGDGHLLLYIFNAVTTRTRRGTALEEFPLIMIGADYNQASLTETGKRLTEHKVPHILVHADIGNPAQLVKDLREQHAVDPDSVMHVRSFLDHDRPFLSPTRSACIWERCHFGGVFVDSAGGMIPAHTMVQGLVEHLERWSAVMGRHGLTVLEVHTADPLVVRKHLHDFVNLSFDAVEGWSSQYLVEPHTWLLCAAGAGLFCERFMSFPQQQSAIRITLSSFVRRPYIATLVQPEDIDEMLQVAYTRWFADICPSRETLQTLAATFPQLQLVFKIDGRIVGWAMAQRVTNEQFPSTLVEDDVLTLGNPEGSFINLLGFFVKPGQQSDLAEEVIRFALLYFSVQNAKAVVGITRFSKFESQGQDMSPEEYLRSGSDPTPKWHESRGAQLLHVIPQYRPRDQESRGCGIALRYDLQTIWGLFAVKPKSAHASAHARDWQLRAAMGPPGSRQEQFAVERRRSVIRAKIMKQYSALTGSNELDGSTPWGYTEVADSLTMVEFRNALSQEFEHSVPLQVTVLFDYPTLDELVAYIDSVLSCAVDTVDVEGIERRRSVIRTKIMKQYSALTGSNELDGSTPWGYTEVADSLTMVEFRNALSQEFEHSVPLQVTLLFDYPTLDDLVAYIDSVLSSSTQHDFAALQAGHSTALAAVQTRLGARIWPTAIVGMACRLPEGCDSPERLWSFLEAKHDAVSEIPLSRIDWRKAYGTGNAPGTSYTKSGAFIWDAHFFDNKRFDLSVAEVNAMDPQQRIALEVAYEAMAQAGFRGSQHKAQTGVFVGECHRDFSHLEGARSHPGPYGATGHAASICSNRISYVFGLTGPSMTIDTACSSSLVAAHAAFNAFATDDCELAVVLGVNLNLTMHNWVEFCAANMLSPRGRCATFSDEADGFVRGEGVGAILLKPLSRVQADADKLWAVLEGTAVNQDGKTSSLTAPNGPSQEKVIRRAVERGGIAADDVAYVEAHGTGTRLGDPQEVGALARVFKGRKNVLVVGAVKSNMGHLEAAAGMLGMIKAVLCLRHGQVPPNIHCKRLNPFLEPLKEECPFTFPQESTELRGLYAGVSSFGFGGTNSHVVQSVAAECGVRPPLPKIEWNREPFPWHSEHPLLGKCEKVDKISRWTCHWGSAMVEYLSNHRFRDMAIVPAVYFLEMVAPAVEELLGNVAYELLDVHFVSLMYIEEERLPRVRMSLEEEEETWRVCIESSSSRDGGWSLHATMVLRRSGHLVESLDVEQIRGRCRKGVKFGEEFYATVGNAYQGDFKALKRAWRGEGEWLGEVETGESEGAGAPAFLRICGWLDSALQVAMMEWDEPDRQSGLYVEKLDVYRVGGTNKRVLDCVYGHHLHQSNGDVLVTIADSEGRVLAQMCGVKLGRCTTESNSILKFEHLQPQRASSRLYAARSGRCPGWDVEGLRGLEDEGRLEAIKTNVRAEVERFAGGVEVGDDQEWGQLELDSLSMMELRNVLQRELGEALQLSSTMLFDYPTLEALAQHIDAGVSPKVKDSMKVVFREVQVEPMAILGMACRFPGGCESPEALWAFLEGKGDGMGEIPLERMDWRKWYDESGEELGKCYINRGAFITGAALFDNGRFGISAAEATAMDPQQRVSLEVAYEAMQQAGVLLQQTSGLLIGTFVAFVNADFPSVATTATKLSPFGSTGACPAIASNRLAHVFGLSGPSMTIDTACSSSLVVMDAACKAIYSHDCELAVTAGVNLMLSMETFAQLCGARMLSRRGRCASFSNDADGYARGEGCGAVVLKRLSKAAEDGDAVWGVLHGLAVNQDGRTATLTAPNGPAQEQVIRRAMERAGIRPDDVGYVEAHGTGTRLGDPLEVGALVNVFRGRETPLVVGAVKSNIGHLEGAAGMAGVIKAVLCLQNRLVPPNIHCERLNELLEPLLKECMCEFPRESIGLAAGVYAGVSSFGYGGTNAHVELGLAPEGTAAPAQPAIDWHRSEFPWLETNADVEATAELCNKDAGILAFEYYCPRLCVRAADIEQFHGQIGWLTDGRGQENVTFCSDDEDAVSMAMSALRRLVDRCQLQWSDIGRLEVGTECQVDRAKSIKTILMSLFEEHGVFDVQGTDTYNACYGGTNALFNAINWVTGNSWNGKYAVVICSDAAVHPDPAHLSEIGASAVAMLIGPGAPMVIEPHKSTFIKNAWDFYRPIGWHNNDALVDLDVATEQYEDALRYCLDSFSEAAGTRDLLSLYDMVVFHCNAPYHSKRSLALLHTHLYGGKLNKEERDTLYEQYAKAGTAISAQNATTYTCPLYACLISLVLEKGEDLVGKRVLCYSYGSGCAASLYGIRVCGVPQHPCGLLEELRSRVPKTVDETLRLVQAFEDTYGRFGFTPSHTADRQRGAYYLSSVDAAGVRLYEEHTSRGVQVDNSAVDVTRITLMQQTIDSTLVDEILEAIQPGRMHIITSACDNFCLGHSEGGEIDLNSFLSKISNFGDLMTCLSKCDMPTIVVCHGATRGGGMLFPGIADIVLATDDASFGLPEIRRGVLPAVVSVALQKRLDCRTSRKWMLTGDRVNAVEAQAAGLVDGIVGTTSGETMEEALDRVLHGLRQSPLHLLQSYKRVVASHGHLETAVVESGVGRLAAKLLSKDGDNVESSDGVVMSWPSPGICLISFTDTLQESNLSWGLVEGLRSRLPKLSESDGLKAIVLDASRVCLAGNVGLWDWIRLLNGSNEDLEVDTTASSLHRVASAYATLFTGVPVPVIMVVSGEVCGPGLAVALSADYRVAEPGARFNYACTESNQLFGVDESMSRLVGECEWAAVLREHEGMVHEDRAGELGLTSTCNSESSALDRALHLAAEVASAPSYGVRATLSLVRHQSDAGAIALRCVSLARSLLRKSVCNAALSNQQEMQEVREGGPKGDVAASTSVVVIDSKMTADELLNRLMTVSRQAEGQTIFVHVTEKGDLLETAAGTEALLSMLEWFLRPQPAVCVQYFSSTEEKSMLLALSPSVASNTTALRVLDFSCRTCRAVGSKATVGSLNRATPSHIQ